MDEKPTDLDRLVLEPVETLEVEYKEWLDLRSKPHKAKLAKELIALRNHGGGHVVLGFSDPAMDAAPRPDEYDYVTADYINGIIASYTDPPFHCATSTVRGHVVISVPAGVTVPVRAKRGSANDEIISDRYYIRRPGPCSEPPKSGLEWDDLLRRCITNRDAELEGLVRRVVRVMNSPAEQMPVRTSALIGDLLALTGSSADWRRFLEKYGYYAVSFALEGPNQPALTQLKAWMLADGPRYTGWSPFWWPTRPEIAPQVVDQSTYECLHDGTGLVGRIERWRASTTGAFAIVRAYDSDCEYEPGKFLELTMPAWRVAELILYAGRMAGHFEAKTVDLTLRYEGLSGRAIRTRAAPNRMLLGDYTTKAKRYERRVSLAADDIDTGVVEMTDSLIRGLFELFQFSLPETLCEEEIARMRSNRF